jgi:Concanavalin A-like lectin/glucanases superfamily
VASAPPPGGAPVGAWGFDETGTTVTDSSGRGNTGTIAGATRTPSGRFGSALTFDGINDWVTVPDSASLDLSTRATLEAWVNPTALGSDWRTVLLKEQPGQLVYALYANNDLTRPSGHLFTTGDLFSSGTAALPLNTWSHLALTWDGTTLRLYVGANQVASRALTGTLVNSTGALRFGGNGVWREWFAGRIDEIRVYDRALTQQELQTDMTTSITGAGLGTARARGARARAGNAARRKAARRAGAGRKRATIDRVRNPGAFPQYTGLTRHTAKRR